MASEDDGKLRRFERRGTLDLLVPAAEHFGWRVSACDGGNRAAFFPPGRAPHLWPPPVQVRKSALPLLLAHAVTLASVQTLRPGQACDLVPPICVKRDLGSLGVGFRRIDDAIAMREIIELPDEDWVVQPFILGVEYRVSLCRNGAYAAAQLMERLGRASRWRDVSEEFPKSWLPDLHGILEMLEVPIIGADILLVGPDRAHVIDVNTAPDIAIHLATQSPRDLSSAIVESWNGTGLGAT